VKGARAGIGSISVDGRPVEFAEGDTVGSCLMRAGVLGLRRTVRGEPRGLFCGIGICQECLVSVGGQRNRRACQVAAIPGLIVETDAGTP
jgi:predicted molibdopterin-dependent oxidoreductase YjgC